MEAAPALCGVAPKLCGQEAASGPWEASLPIPPTHPPPPYPTNPTKQDGVARLKRVIMIGDHHQLPPVVQNMAFQKYSRLDQSLFARFVRLGTPYVELDAQGRARPSIAALYNWRYRALGDLPRVREVRRGVLRRAGGALWLVHAPTSTSARRPCSSPATRHARLP
jgi:hypothetical protein